MFKVHRCLMMDSRKFVVILLLYCVMAAYCYPPKPLNERMPSEITWQAWLLVNDENQNKQQTNADGMLRRRITPKSVFIAPSFDPESLPPCSEGYSSDAKGACVPIIKFDEDAHYEFLIQKLKDKLGPVDYDYEEMPTQGPLQINIPLQVDAEEDDGETSAAIVISPTKIVGGNLDKRDGAEDEKKQEMFLKKLASTTTKQTEETTVTVTEPVTEKGSTLIDDFTDATESLTTTEDFTTPTESHNTKRSTGDVEKDITTTTEEDVETTTFELTTSSSFELYTPSPKVAVPITQPHSHISFKFPQETVTQKLVKFPESNVSFRTQIPSSVEPISGVDDISNDAPFPQSAETLAGNRKVVFREQSQPEVANLDYSNGGGHLPTATTFQSFNRRNRDKSNNMFLLPPRWSQPNFQKPLVLRFSRKHAYLDDVRFKHPDYYRSVPMDDFAYLFNRHKPSGHR